MPLVQSLASSLPHCTSQRLVSSNVMLTLRTPRFIAAPTSALAHQHHDQAITIQRQPTNYQPSIWGRDYIQSITSHISEDNLEKRAEKLKEEVRVMIGRVVDPLEQLELIDVLERLIISHHFDDEIEMILTTIHWNDYSSTKNKSLHEVALAFRLLRQHGNDVSEDVFTPFMDESSGDFKSCLSKDIKGILSLYEASYVLVRGEGILEKTRDFTTKHLEDYVNDYYKHDKDRETEDMTLTSIRHALEIEIPQHWTAQRVESRWFIDAYTKRHDKNRILLELAELDFNMLQADHQDDSPITQCL